MKNIKVIENFLKHDNNCQGSNLWNIKAGNNLNVLYNYNAKIAVFTSNKCIINKKWLHYTKTTQININKIITLCNQKAIYIEYATLCD